MPCGIHRAFTRADDAWRAELAATTIADLVVGVVQEAPRAGAREGRPLDRRSRPLTPKRAELASLSGVMSDPV